MLGMNPTNQIQPSEKHHPGTELEMKEEAALLHKAINGLTENQRIAFTLNKYEELPYSEISEIMGVSLSSVESLIHRAKINLQQKLMNHYRNR